MISEIKQRITQLNNGEVPNGYKKTEFGVFPCDWVTDKRLKEIGTFGKGKGLPGEKMISEGVPCVGYGDIYMKYNNFHFEKAKSFVDKETASKSQPIQKGTLLFTGTGETAEEIGKCVCYNGYETIYAGGDIITFISNEVNPLFLAYQQYQDFSLRNKASFGQGHSVVHIRQNNLEKLHVAYPKSADEQSKIAEILMKWDEAIELYNQYIEKLKQIKSICLKKMFPKKGERVPEWRYNGFTDAWKQRKLGEVGTTYTGLSGKTKEDFGHGKGQFVTYMNVFSNPIGLLDMTEAVEIDNSQNKVLFGDVLFTTSSETPEEVGMSSVWLENTENTYLNSFCFGYRPTVEFNLYYLAYVLRSSSMRKKITFLAQGISRYNISKSKMMDIQIPIPNIEEQKQIGVYFRSLDNLITLHQCKVEKIKAQQKVLQKYLLNGIVRV